MSRGFPWDHYMRIGLGMLRLAPRDFWSASPREIAAAFGRTARSVPGRAAIEEMMQRFPDET